MSNLEFARFINIAEGSAAESFILVDISTELLYAPKERLDRLGNEFEGLERQMCAFRKTLGD